MLKRFICILMCFLMLASVGCADKSTDISAGEMSDIQSITDIAVSDGNSGEVSKTENYAAQIDALLGNSANREMNKKNVIAGSAYTTSVDAHADYPDKKAVLTDGVQPQAFNRNENWAGYVMNADETNVIDIDLGKVTDNIMDFTVRSLDLETYAIYAPKMVAVYVAGEDGNYTKLGTAHRPDGELSQDSYRDYSIYLQGTVSARYIRFEITAAKKGWCFIGEVNAMAYSDKYDEYSALKRSLNDYYGYEGIPVIGTPEYWQEGDDYNQEKNLLEKKKAIISASEYADNSLITEWYNTRNTAMFTDGRRAVLTNIGDAAWFHITHGATREITFDLEKISAVSGFSAGFLYDAAAGVQYPTDVAVKLSLDGVSWQTVYSHEGVRADEDEEIFRYEEDFGKEYKARYFQLTFTVNNHTYIDEITAIGKKNASAASELIPNKEVEEDKVYDGYAMPEDFYGVNNMLLSYHCYTDSSNKSDETGLITAEEYLPHVAYLDENGNIKDTFFDAYLYLPYTKLIHGEGSNFGRSADGWRTYVDDMFYEDRNMDALDACAEKVYSELGITDEKLKVFTSILYTFTTLYDGSKNPFGDIDGDGVNEDFANIEDRKKAIKWIMDEELNRFNEGDYKNLEFCGYYWFEESIAYSDPHETELIAFAVDYAHTLGYKIFWIPYNSAAGIRDWEELGFDVACLQPNYMFNASSSADILYETAKTASKLGMCVELEINDPNNQAEASKYIEYLIAGAETGFMNAIKMYYQVGVPGAFHTACYSETPEVRALYDNTYLFAKEKFEPVWPEDVIISETPLEFKYTVGTEFSGSIDISHLEGISGNMVVTLSPKYGSVKLNNDGSFIYYPAEGFDGTDSFEIAFDLGYGTPCPTVIKLISE